MKRPVLVVLLVGVIAGAVLAVRGCYDPAEDTVQVTGGNAEQSQISIDATDIKLPLTADNTDIKWTGSNAIGQTPHGYFYELDGNAVLDDESEELKAVEVDIRMDSVKAMAPALTKKLQNEGFFEVEKFPTSRFESTSISAGPREGDPEGTTHVIKGNLQLRDVTRSIEIPVAVEITPEKFMLKSEFSLNRNDYGVVYSDSTQDALIRDDVVLNLDLNVERK